MQAVSLGCRSHLRPFARTHSLTRSRMASVRVHAGVNVGQLKELKADLHSYITSKNCNPIVVRLAWHDSGTYDKSISEWPKAGGATASIRFRPEIGHGANAGLQVAMDLLEGFHTKYPDVSYSDLYQMASAVGIEAAGGPKIPMRYGRLDASGPEACAKEGNLPSACHPFADGSSTPGEHLKKVFHRMGLTDQDIVVLSGAHTIGRAKPERSGWGKESTKYTEKGPGTPGGQSWTPDWLTFNNHYFVEVKAKRDAELLVLPTDAAVFEDEGFRPYAELYASDEGAFFADYAKSHAKLSELGVKWAEGGPVTLD